MVSSGKSSVSLNDIKEVTTEAQIISYYLGINDIPCIINSPLRKDSNPSFGIYSPNGLDINYIDFATKEGGRLYTLLSKIWKISVDKVYERIYNDFSRFSNTAHIKAVKRSCRIKNHSDTVMECKTREWRDYDIKYWESYGISLRWLKYANVYPISHKIIYKDGRKYVFGADKYAYAYAEFKDGKTTLKIYQPFNKKGFKWSNKHDKSVISLWTKVPEKGDIICICSSLKDALCLWANTGIPAIAIQGEGYTMSKTAVEELKRRFKHQYILLDNDEAGIKDAESLSKATGFTNIVLPRVNNAKDISDMYLLLNNKETFKQIIFNLFNTQLWKQEK